jgi:hypothetical protein
MATKPQVEKVGWRPNEFGQALGISRAQVAEMIADGTLASVKMGGARIILTAPRDYLASLAKPADKTA